MTAQSPRPIAHRAFSLLVAVLLVGSMVAPIAAAEPVAAQDNSMSFEGTCESDLQYILAISCGHADFADDGGIDESQAASSIEQDIHVGATGVKASQDSTDQLMQNYLQDTDSIASIEARNAIATAYESEEDPSVADTQAKAAINAYYARLQIQLIEDVSVQTTQLSYYSNLSQNEAEINNEFVHTDPFTFSGETQPSTVDTYTQNVTLANGSTYEATMPALDANENPNVYVADWREGGSYNYDWTGLVLVENTGSLESKAVFDYRLVRDRFQEIAAQSDEVVANYDDGTAQGFYDALDAGEIEVEDLRGAEGMVRYLSGDANVSEERYQYALRSVLDMNRESLDSTMVVEFEGATEKTRVVNETDGSVSYEYNHVNETYEGLLFSSSTPTDGFETGVTYDVLNLDGTQKMVTGGDDGNRSDVIFYQGEFTITEMYDEDGNSIEQTDLTETPEYGTFNATEYQIVIEQADEDREAITSGDDDGTTIGLPENPFDGEGSGAFVGLVIIGAGIVVIAVLVLRP